MTVLYFVSLPMLLVVVAVATVALKRARRQLTPCDRDPDPHQIASALGSYRYVRQGTVFFTGLVIALTAVAIWQATQGDTDALKSIPIAIAVLLAGLWIANLDVRIRCEAIGIPDPKNYFRDRADQPPHRD